ncbi:MAG: helix-turn-helix domain-containing protein [Pseudomonadota bacterium]|nr:helix-turn-helix domain-containing protein [Pseudomonadota bacterium]
MASIVGRNIRRIRKRSGYSQAVLAKLARTSQAWICRLETGDENPTLGSVMRIARALDVEAAELLQEPAQWSA